MADVSTLGFDLPEEVRLKVAELDLELSEGKENLDFSVTQFMFSCQIDDSDSFSSCSENSFPVNLLQAKLCFTKTFNSSDFCPEKLIL